MSDRGMCGVCKKIVDDFVLVHTGCGECGYTVSACIDCDGFRWGSRKVAEHREHVRIHENGRRRLGAKP